MAEPTVQVPVSLIERNAAEYEREGWPLAAQKWRTLLFPQPTPSACICGPQSIVSDGPSTDCPTHGEPAAPPSIADLAPGTTFTACYSAWTLDGSGLVATRRRFVAPSTLVFRQIMGGLVDPSTIRDVTPPESPNAI